MLHLVPANRLQLWFRFRESSQSTCGLTFLHSLSFISKYCWSKSSLESRGRAWHCSVVKPVFIRVVGYTHMKRLRSMKDRYVISGLESRQRNGVAYMNMAASLAMSSKRAPGGHNFQTLFRKYVNWCSYQPQWWKQMHLGYNSQQQLSLWHVGRIGILPPPLRLLPNPPL